MRGPQHIEKSGKTPVLDPAEGRARRGTDKLDASTLSTADGFTAFRLLAPSLESLTLLRAKIGEQRAAEARDETALQ